MGGITLQAIENQIRLLTPEGQERKYIDVLMAIGVEKSKLWHDPDGVGYATFEWDRHLEHHGLEQEGFLDFLSFHYGEMNKMQIGSEAITLRPKKKELDEAIYQLHGIARRKEEKTPSIRYAYHNDALWLDLGDKDWAGVRITADDWEIVDRLDVPIVRGTGIRPLPRPERGGSISDLRPFANVRDDEDFVLFCGATAGLLCPFGDYTTTVFCGPAGSGKTTATLVMRRLVDPHKADTRPMSGVRNLMLAGSNTRVVALENVRHIEDDMSDAICRLNTGTSHTERQLYTNHKEFMAKVHCPVLINGIPGNLAEREDLADRAVTFNFPLLGEKFQGKNAFWRKFDLARPKLLGALLDGVVGALRVRRDFGGDNDAAALSLLSGRQFRFLDFAVWAEAACRAMGFDPGTFAEAYHSNRDYALRFLASNDTVCVGVARLMQNQDEWCGLPGQLYQEIKPFIRGLEPLRGPSKLSSDDLPHAIPLLRKVHSINVQMKKSLPFDTNHNGNGIIIQRVTTSNHSAPSSPALSETPREVRPEVVTTGYGIKRRRA